MNQKYAVTYLYPRLSSKVSCGLFGITDEFVENYQSLDELLIKNKYSTFFFEATGDSMEPTILTGDILIVDRSIAHYHGRVCILAFEDKLICKRVQKNDRGLTLFSDNSKYAPIHVQSEDAIALWGVVIGRAGKVR